MTTNTNHTPEDIRETARALDHLAHHDAGAAPPGLEDRIFLRTAASFTNPSAHAEAAAPAPIPMWRRPVMRLAAALALVVIASLFFLIPSQSNQTAEIDTDLILEELDSILSVAYESDPIAEFDSLDSELAELLAADTFDELNSWLESEEAL